MHCLDLSKTATSVGAEAAVAGVRSNPFARTSIDGLKRVLMPIRTNPSVLTDFRKRYAVRTAEGIAYGQAN